MTHSSLDEKTFSTIIKNTPLISIDLIIKNKEGKILLGMRKNEPAKNFWFVPGGRIFKDEPIRDALKRLAHDELGLEIDSKPFFFIGIFEHLYQQNVFDENGFGTHYVVLAHELRLEENPGTLPVVQHSDFKWFTRLELISDSSVHKNTKAYFESAKNQDHPVYWKI